MTLVGVREPIPIEKLSLSALFEHPNEEDESVLDSEDEGVEDEREIADLVEFKARLAALAAKARSGVKITRPEK